MSKHRFVPTFEKSHEPEATLGSPTVVAVVLNWNGWRDTVACLESLLRNSRPPRHIIVCDNASTDESLRKLEEWAAGALRLPLHSLSEVERKLIDPPTPKPIELGTVPDGALHNACLPDVPIVLVQLTENLGFAGGMNVGWAISRRLNPKSFVLLLNNDTLLPRDFLEKAVSHIAEAPDRQSIGLLGFPAVSDFPSRRIEQICAVDKFGRGPVPVCDETLFHQVKGERISVSGYAMFIPPWGKQTRFVDDYFLYCEDADLCQRVWGSGQYVDVDVDNPLFHKRSRSVGFSSPLQIYYTRRNKLTYVWRHRTTADYLAVLARAVVSTLRGLLWSLLNADRLRARAYWLAIAHHICGKSGNQWTPIH